MKILLADDHALLRVGLRQILAEAFPTAQFGEAATARETLALLEHEPWDLLLLDIFMPGMDGLAVLEEVRARKWRLPVLVLTTAPEDQLAVRVLRAGAAGYVTKQTAPEHLVAAVKTVLSGARYVSQALAGKLAHNLAHPARTPAETLSDREYQVLQLLAAGRSMKEIAAEMGVSAKTVSTFHTRIWEKLGVTGDVALGRYALQEGLLELPPRPAA